MKTGILIYLDNMYTYNDTYKIMILIKY